MSSSSDSQASRTDWERIRSLKDEDIDLSEIPEITEEQIRKAVLRSNSKPTPRIPPMTKEDRDLEKTYPMDEFVAKLRRLVDCLESGEQFDIQVAGERIYVPLDATYNIEHEREDGEEEIEFQIKWKR